MTSLPSFVELMATLGLEESGSAPDPPFSPFTSPSRSPRLNLTAPSPTHTRSRSNPGMRDATTAARAHPARFSPYAPSYISGRRGSTASASDVEPPNRALSSSPNQRRLRRHASAHLTVNIFDSACDLSANTPISSYVRRGKTPGASPTSSTFSHSSNSSSMNGDASPNASPMPFSIPTLPVLFPRSPTSESNFPLTPDATMDVTPSLLVEQDYSSSPSLTWTKPLPEMTAEAPFSRRSGHFNTAVRISSASPRADYGRT